MPLLILLYATPEEGYLTNAELKQTLEDQALANQAGTNEKKYYSTTEPTSKLHTSVLKASRTNVSCACWREHCFYHCLSSLDFVQTLKSLARLFKHKHHTKGATYLVMVEFTKCSL